MDEDLKAAVDLFNSGHFSEFQDALGGVASGTRAASERQFYGVLDKLAEALLQLSDGDVEDAENLVSVSLRKLDEFVPRFRALNVEALREDFRRLLIELRDIRAGRRAELAPTRLPRIRVLPE